MTQREKDVALADYRKEVNNYQYQLPRYGTPEYDAMKIWIANRIEDRRKPEFEKLKRMKKYAEDVVDRTMYGIRIKTVPSRVGQFNKKIFADIDYFKKLIADRQRPIMIEDIGLFDEPEPQVRSAPKGEPWVFKGVEYFKYKNHVWLNEDGVQGEYMGRYDGNKLDASEAEPDW
jgi:hypothetical protein